MPPRQHWLIGKKVGEYEIVGRIGEGGMGEVFEGRHPIIGKRVAIKTLLPHFSHDEALTQRFVAEARAVNAIRHRGIVDMFGFGKLDDGTQYIIMELLEGIGLDALIAEHAPMPAPEVVEWVDQIVDALGAAHAAGVIHRDIKPSNIFLVDTGHGPPYVKLLDFGIAKTDAVRGRQTPQTQASMILGTPDYMAPEQARGEPVGAPTDFYALGCVTYHMLTGQPPYAGAQPMGTMFAHVDRPVMRPGLQRPDLLPALDDLATWMMAKAPVSRPQSAADIQQALDAMWPALFGAPHRRAGRWRTSRSEAKTQPMVAGFDDEPTTEPLRGSLVETDEHPPRRR
jgi:serine/threonine-protein kinase